MDNHIGVFTTDSFHEAIKLGANPDELLKTYFLLYSTVFFIPVTSEEDYYGRELVVDIMMNRSGEALDYEEVYKDDALVCSNDFKSIYPEFMPVLMFYRQAFLNYYAQINGDMYQYITPTHAIAASVAAREIFECMSGLLVKTHLSIMQDCLSSENSCQQINIPDSAIGAIQFANKVNISDYSWKQIFQFRKDSYIFDFREKIHSNLMKNPTEDAKHIDFARIAKDELFDFLMSEKPEKMSKAGTAFKYTFDLFAGPVFGSFDLVKKVFAKEKHSWLYFLDNFRQGDK